MPLFAIAGLPQIRLSLFCDAWFIILPILHHMSEKGWNSVPRLRPVFKPFLWMSLLIFLSSVVSFLPLFNSVNSAIVESVSSYIFPLLFFAQIRESKDLKFVITALMIVSVIAAIYGVLEGFVFGFKNPLVLYEQSLNPNITENMWSYETLARGGRGRVSSIFAHAIGCGCTMSIFAVFFLYVKSAFKCYIISNKLYYAAIISAVLLIGLCNSRSPFPLFFIPLLALVKSKSFLKIAGMGVLFLIVFQSELSSFIDVFLSIFDKKLESQMGGGSNVEMRTGQYEALFKVWLSGNPIIGQGAYATRFWIDKRIGLLGAESMWIPLLLNTGVLGCAFILLIMRNLVKLGTGYGKKMIFFFVLGWLVMRTSSSSPGLDISLFFMMMFCVAKLDMISQNTYIESSCKNNSCFL